MRARAKIRVRAKVRVRNAERDGFVGLAFQEFGGGLMVGVGALEQIDA